MQLNTTYLCTVQPLSCPFSTTYRVFCVTHIVYKTPANIKIMSIASENEGFWVELQIKHHLTQKFCKKSNSFFIAELGRDEDKFI